MQKTKFHLLLFVVSTVLIACNSTPESAATATPKTAVSVTIENPIIIGDISDEVAETIEGTQPFADYIAQELESFGITKGLVKIAPDLDTMIQWMNEGEVDIYSDSPYPALVISQQTGATPILRRLKYGVDQYHSVFIVREDSDIETLDDLMGQVVAFEESFSTSGYMLPLAYLIQNDKNPVDVSSPNATVSDDQIGYTFSTADNTTIQWIISGRVPAGVIDNVTLGRLPEETQAELRVIAATEDVPRQLVLVNGNMDEELVSALKTKLLEMDENEAGQAALDIFLTSEFTEFPEGADAALDQMNTLYQLVQEN